MGTFSKVASVANIGGTADTFAEVGSLNLDSEAIGIIGLIVAAAIRTKTANEANQSQLRVTVDDLGITREVIPLGGGWGGAPDTNIGRTPGIYDIIPVDWAGGENAKGAQVDIEFSSSQPDPTGTYDVAVGVMYADESIPDDFWDRYPLVRKGAKGFDAEANAAVTTVAETAITSLVIPGKVNNILGLRQQAIPDADATQQKAICGFIRYRSEIKTWGTQEYPFPPFNAFEGTPVGIGASLPSIQAGWIPVEHPVTLAKKLTIDPYAVLVEAPTDASGVQAGVAYSY